MITDTWKRLHCVTGRCLCLCGFTYLVRSGSDDWSGLRGGPGGRQPASPSALSAAAHPPTPPNMRLRSLMLLGRCVNKELRVECKREPVDTAVSYAVFWPLLRSKPEVTPASSPYEAGHLCIYRLSLRCATPAALCVLQVFIYLRDLRLSKYQWEIPCFCAGSGMERPVGPGRGRSWTPLPPVQLRVFLPNTSRELDPATIQVNRVIMRC